MTFGRSTLFEYEQESVATTIQFAPGERPADRMKRNFDELFVKMKPAAQARVKARSSELLRAMALADLRRAQARTQQQLAQTHNVNQAWISRVERKTAMYLSTLRGYVEALGGELELTARFDNNVVRLDQVADPESFAVTAAAKAPLKRKRSS